MVGITNEEEKQKIEMQRSQLLSALEEKKKSLTMLSDEIKIMVVRKWYNFKIMFVEDYPPF